MTKPKENLHRSNSIPLGTEETSHDVFEAENILEIQLIMAINS